MKRLLIDPQFADRFTALGLNAYDAIVNFFSEPGPAPGKETVSVKPRALRFRDDTMLDVFYKQYDFPTPAWRFVARRSKARCEYDNYRVFAELVIPCPVRIACGEDRDAFGRLRRAFIITEAIPRARTLTDFFPTARGNRVALIQQLAAMVRRIHTANFFHHDLVWRNILVTDECKLWWIDCPRGSVVRLPWAQRRRQLKDLASLDKSAEQYCTHTERLRFLLSYLDQSRLDAAGKQLARDTRAYRQQRWP